MSSRVSPLVTEELAAVQLRASAESTLAAISKELRVRVEVSKKRFTTDLAAQATGTFFTGREQHLLHGDGQVEHLRGSPRGRSPPGR